MNRDECNKKLKPILILGLVLLSGGLVFLVAAADGSTPLLSTGSLGLVVGTILLILVIAIVICKRRGDRR